MAHHEVYKPQRLNVRGEQDFQPSSGTKSQRSFSWLHRNPTDGGMGQKDQEKDTSWQPVKAASRAALTPPPARPSARAGGASPTQFSPPRGANAPCTHGPPGQA